MHTLALGGLRWFYTHVGGAPKKKGWESLKESRGPEHLQRQMASVFGDEKLLTQDILSLNSQINRQNNHWNQPRDFYRLEVSTHGRVEGGAPMFSRAF